MIELADRLQADVKAARAAGNVSALLAVANAAVDELAAAAAAAAAPDPDEGAARELLLAAKKIAYNAAADAWPGWEVGGQARSAEELRMAGALAARGEALVARLDLDGGQRGNAAWLVAAFDLALGDYAAAVAGFESAAAAFGGEREASLMALGYRAIAGRLLGVVEAGLGFDEVVGELRALGTEEAGWFVEQLVVAREVFAVG